MSSHRSQPSGFPCRRCHLLFPSADAINRHFNESIDHNICHLCTQIRKDFETFSQLQDHLENDHLYCEVCNWFAPSKTGLIQHNISRHYMCSICNRYFVNIHELNGHAISTHRPRSALCILCNRDFPTLSSTFSHIESGKCTEGVTRDDVRTLTVEFLNSNRIAFTNPFDCRVCHRPFNRMCDLLQHAETRACSEGYWADASSNTGLGALVEHVRHNLRNAVNARRQNQRLSLQGPAAPATQQAPGGAGSPGGQLGRPQ
ncbi:hypothetical protein DTO271G3_1442 [Paecilomyces variotii]|nr:hypothetical protein DTO271G3_1442 [Paecilomyces variotii]